MTVLQSRAVAFRTRAELMLSSCDRWCPSVYRGGFLSKIFDVETQKWFPYVHEYVATGAPLWMLDASWMEAGCSSSSQNKLCELQLMCKHVYLKIRQLARGHDRQAKEGV
ncbi:hypothetical protein EVAR_5031_1 [Eumeta japonica]|uniref:Uncharacterized protein n=1 Tax=Eumeta variegata TaxID=151549 RepID=A0A4C1SUR8_EUMVA|nr:hypothetical protein EVAR_5031_1 [Eumeta japonica]